MTEAYKLIIFFQNKDPVIFFSYLKQLLESSLVFTIVIATMQSF